MSHMRRLCRLIGVWLLLSTLAWPVYAEKQPESDVARYQRAMRVLERGNVNEALNQLERVHAPLLKLIGVGALMASPDTPYDFQALSGFLTEHPVWPDAKAIQVQAEKNLPATYSITQVLHWFESFPPLSLAGFDRMIAALQAHGSARTAQMRIRDRWINGSFGAIEQQDFLKNYRDSLRPADHWARLDRLLWEDADSAAARMLPLVSKGYARLAKARMAPSKQTIAAVPASLRRDPGLLFIALRQARRNDDDAQAIRLLDQQPEHSTHENDWWEERAIIVRRQLAKNDARGAYRLAAHHHLDAGKEFHEGEFLAGWIALRFLKDPTSAMRHFRRVFEKSSTPISRARGAYWAGRAAAMLGPKTEAQRWYGRAVAYPTTFYGQLALAAMEAQPVLTLSPAKITADIRHNFARQPMLRIATLLHEIGEDKRAERFLIALADKATREEEFRLLAEWAQERERYDLAVRIGKRAGKDGYVLDREAYPIPDYRWPSEPEQALVLAVIRQESVFTPDIVSPAKAQGLMQLLPSTARELARKMDIGFSPERLYEPNYNIRLGCSFLNKLINQFDGSLPLAIAAYNAGPARVREWTTRIGDPRQGRDPIDWIELIPVAETRNYIQRVIEGLQIYRALLAQGRSTLRIYQDLH